MFGFICLLDLFLLVGFGIVLSNLVRLGFSSSSACGFLSLLVVLDVEMDKEDEESDVGNDREFKREVRELLVLSADSACGGTDECVFINHSGDADNELSDLDLSDITLPPTSHAQSSNRVVIVHKSMNDHVSPCTDCSIGTVIDVKEPGERESDEMVIDMKETKTRFTSNKEHCVNKLPCFREEEEEQNPAVESLKQNVC